MIELLSYEDALVLIDELGFVLVDPGLLSSAVARPAASFGGVDAYPDLFGKVAALLHSVARNHALIDGNKRTAWAMARVTLLLNGYRLMADDLEGEDFMVEVAQDHLSLDEIAKWMRDRSDEVGA